MKKRLSRLRLAHLRFTYALGVEMILFWQQFQAVCLVVAAGLYYPLPYIVAVFISFDQLISQTVADTRAPAQNYHEIGDRRALTRPNVAKIAVTASFGLMLITAISLVAATTLAPQFALYPLLYIAYVFLITVLYGIVKRLKRLSRALSIPQG